MAHVIKAQPEDFFPKQLRWIKVWRSPDGNCWASKELAIAWAQEQILGTFKVEEKEGFMPVGEYRVFITEEGKRWTAWELGVELEIQDYDDKVRARALMKLSAEERRILGVEA